MSKDPREGLRLRLGYEVAREIEKTPVIAPGVSDAAIRAVNSVLFQRLQEQVVDDNPTARILEERIRDINITNIASENNINKADLIAVLQSGAFQGPLGDKGPPGDKGDPLDLLELQVHPRVRPVSRVARGAESLAGQPWMKVHPPLSGHRLQTIHLHPQK